jgi:type IV secretion system protein VirD4
MRFFKSIRPVDQFERASHTIGWLAIVALAVFAFLQWPIVTIVLLVIAARRMYSNQKTSGNTFGSARWADAKDLKRAGCLRQGSGVRLGRMIGGEIPTLPQVAGALISPPWRTQEALTVLNAGSAGMSAPYVYLPDPGPPHVAVFSPPGGGKTTCYAIPNLLSDPSSAVVLDAKGDLANLTAAYRRKHFGHQIVIIDPFRIAKKAGKASKFNPLTLYRDNPGMLIDDSRRLANALIIRSKDEREPFFSSAAQVVIQTVLGFLLTAARPELANLNHLRNIATNPDAMKELLEYIKKNAHCGEMLQRLAGNVKWYQGQTEASVYAVANTHLEFLDSEPIADTLSDTDFDPQKLIDGKMTIYLCLPVDRIQELRGLQRIMLTALINLIFQAGESRERRIRFYLDEAVSLGDIDALYNAMVYGRSYGMRLMFFYQSTSQVQQGFPESKAADFQASVASVFCGVNDYRTAQEVSQWIGQTTVESQSYQSSDNWGKSWNQSHHDHSQGGSYGGGSSMTYAQVGRALIQPEEVLQLPPSMAIALLPGVRPVLFEKTPYYQASAKPTSAMWKLCRSVGRLAFALIGIPFLALVLRSAVVGNPNVAINEVEALAKSLVSRIEAPKGGVSSTRSVSTPKPVDPPTPRAKKAKLPAKVNGWSNKDRP